MIFRSICEGSLPSLIYAPITRRCHDLATNYHHSLIIIIKIIIHFVMVIMAIVIMILIIIMVIIMINVRTVKSVLSQISLSLL